MASSRRRSRNSKWIGAILVGIAVVILIVTFTSKKGMKKNTKQIVIGIAQEPDSLDPLFMEMGASHEMYSLIFQDDIERDDKWDLQARFITMIPTLENGLMKTLSGNRTQVTWNIKEGMKWSDGHPLTSADYLFAHRLISDDRLPIISRNFLKRIEKVEAPDPLTFVVTWKEPYAYANLGHQILPKHILEATYEKDPANYYKSFFNRHPIGNGPFKLEEWSAGSHLIFTQNPHWYGKKPEFEKIIYRIISNTNAMESNLLAGSIDAITSFGLSLDQALDFERRHGHSFTFHYRPALTWERISCNLDNPILKDKRVRQALLYGANRQKMVDILFQGKQQVADSWIPPNHYGYNPNIKHYPFNRDKAKSLLKEAGWIKTPSGIRVNKFGQPLKLTIMTTSGDKTREQVEQLLQDDWRHIGVQLLINNQPAKVYFGETIRKRKFTDLAMYASTTDPIYDGVTAWTIDNIPTKENNWHGQNATGWRHEEASRILHKIPGTLSKEKRRSLLHQQQVIWSEEVPTLSLYFRSQVTVTHKKLRNWKPTGTLHPITWNAEEWYFEK